MTSKSIDVKTGASPLIARSAALVAAALVAAMGIVPAAAGVGCVPPEDTTARISLANPAHDAGTVTETGYFLATLTSGPSPIAAQQARDRVQGLDAFVVATGCALKGGAFAVFGEDGGQNAFSLRLRFYAEEGGFTGAPTRCAAQLSGHVPSYTHYVVIVLCKGVPYDTYGVKPVSVKARLLLAT